jgi:hypothetical protein
MYRGQSPNARWLREWGKLKTNMNWSLLKVFHLLEVGTKSKHICLNFLINFTKPENVISPSSCLIEYHSKLVVLALIIYSFIKTLKLFKIDFFQRKKIKREND